MLVKKRAIPFTTVRISHEEFSVIYFSNKTANDYFQVNSPVFLSTNDWNYDNPWQFLMKIAVENVK